MSKEVPINSITEYIQMICAKNIEMEENCFWQDEELLFRGQSNKDYELIPAIGRNRPYATDITIFNEERNLIDLAKFKLPDVFKEDVLPIELLAMLQHHGIPTRLLDVSENALVALYFACCSNQDVDGEVIVFKHKNISVTNYPIVNAIADSYRFTTKGTWTSLARFYGDIKNQPYCLEQKQTFDILHLDNVAGGKWIEECCKNIIYIYAPVRSLRQQVQQGRYILFPNRIEHEFHKEGGFQWTIDAIPKDHEDIVLRLTIPNAIKKRILMDLSVLGITEDFLFCDSIDAVCNGILRKSKKRCKK